MEHKALSRSLHKRLIGFDYPSHKLLHDNGANRLDEPGDGSLRFYVAYARQLVVSISVAAASVGVQKEVDKYFSSLACAVFDLRRVKVLPLDTNVQTAYSVFLLPMSILIGFGASRYRRVLPHVFFNDLPFLRKVVFISPARRTARLWNTRFSCFESIAVDPSKGIAVILLLA